MHFPFAKAVMPQDMPGKRQQTLHHTNPGKR